ncbi:hypothetical protein BEN74_10605 [Acinetobacter sp. WCHAc010034]|nr:hypothetical protein BEN74_10605 [Acinetobacter sp. WCHAc010034]
MLPPAALRIAGAGCGLPGMLQLNKPSRQLEKPAKPLQITPCRGADFGQRSRPNNFLQFGSQN